MHDARRRGWTVRPFSGSSGGQAGDDEDYRRLSLGAGAQIDPADFHGCDTLVHLAAHIPSDHDDIEAAARCWDVNAIGTARLVEAAAAAGVQRFVHMSSANAYAVSKAAPDEHAAMFPESREYYFASKIAQELYAQHACRQAGISATTLRLTAGYGAAQANNLVVRLARQLLAGETVELAGNGLFGVDFVTVTDVSRAISLVLEHRAEGIYNIGSGVRTTIVALTEQLCELTGTPQQAIILRDTGETRDHGFAAPDITAISNLGFAPTALSDGLRELVDSLRNATDAD